MISYSLSSFLDGNMAHVDNNQHTKKFHFLCVSILLLYVAPYFVLGENAYLILADGLDSNLLWHTLLARYDLLFAAPDAVIAPMANMPRASLGSEFFLVSWFYLIFPPYWAFAVNLLCVHVIGYVSAYLLFSKYVCADKKVASMAALCFALLPFWTYGGISVSAMPLALYAFLNIRNGERKISNWLILFFIPFYSSFILSMMFFMCIPGLIWVHDVVRYKRFNAHFFTAIAMMTALYIAIDYRLLLFVIDPLFETHRNEFHKDGIGWYKAGYVTAKNFFIGQYHANPLHLFFIMPAGVMAFLVTFFLQRKIHMPLFLCFFIVGVTALIYGFWEWHGMNVLKDNFFLFRAIQFDRFHFLQPLLWACVFAFSLRVFWARGRIGKAMFYGLVIAQIGYCFYGSDMVKQYRKAPVSFASFYAVEQMQEIQNFIDRPLDEYRVLSVGMHPSIALYNGFYTADFYLANYPAAYKHDFRKVIASELEKDQTLKKYFDNWGSRAYVFSHENGRDFTPSKDPRKTLKDFDINIQAARNLGAEYVLSKYKIDNTKMRLMRVFEHEKSAWVIYLYAL